MMIKSIIMNFKELLLKIPTFTLDEKFIQMKRLIKNSDCNENVNVYNTDAMPTLRRLSVRIDCTIQWVLRT